MLDVSGFILHKILSDPKAGLEIWPKIKVPYFDAAYSSIVSAINKFYVKYNDLPSFEDLDTFIRAGHIKDNLQALRNLDVPEDVELDVLFDALQNAYTQKEALGRLDDYLDKVAMMDCEEMKEGLVDIALYLEEKTRSSEHIYTMADMTVFDKAELNSRVPLGLNNTFDAHIGGVALTELVLIGGKKGTGKSVVSVNVALNQYELGYTCPIFTIEMRAREVYNRCISALAGVSNTKIRKGCPSEEDLTKIAKVRAEMFADADDAYTKFLETRNFDEFEYNLIKNYRLKPDNQLIIIDNQQLSLADIDFNLQKLKTQFGEKLKVAVVDYVNQIAIEDMYDWKSQISLAKGLKNLARKYEIAIIAPYQIDDKGVARFAKGLLDSPDIAIILEKHENAIAFETQKIRNAPPMDFASVCNWDTLRIKPTDAVVEKPEIQEEKPTRKIKKGEEDL